MSDLVERLRDRDRTADARTRRELREAADEIERLRGIGPRLKAFAHDRYPDISGPGWLQRAGEQQVVHEFIEGFLAREAAEAAGGSE